MALTTVKTVSVYSGVAHESSDSIDVNPDMIVMIKKVYYSIEKEVEEDGQIKNKLVPTEFYKVSFSNGEAISLTETEKNKIA